MDVTRRPEFVEIVVETPLGNDANGHSLTGAMLDLSRVVMVNLTSTEKYTEVADVHRTLDAFDAGLDRNDPLISPVFSTNPGGTAEWHGVTIPAAGTWTLDVIDTSDDSVTATTSVVVS